MDAVVQEKMIRILKGELKYTSSNLAFNMMIAKLQKRLKSDPACIEACIGELEGFMFILLSIVTARIYNFNNKAKKFPFNSHHCQHLLFVVFL